MPAKKTKKKIIKIPCHPLNKIFEVKYLDKGSLTNLVNRMKREVSKSSGIKDIMFYVTFLVTNIISPDDKKWVLSVIEDINENEESEDIAKSKINVVFASIYNSITEYFPSLSIDYICSDLNDVVINEVDNSSPFIGRNKYKLNKKTSFKTPEDRLEFIEDVRRYLSENIIGQEHAVTAICDSLKLKLSGFTQIISLFFAGPTGVGKTQISKLLADKFEGRLLQLNCADFSNGHEMNRLIGPPPGYIGFTGKSFLQEKSAESNRWVILFDEIEKAHIKFFNFLLALLDTGKVQDNLGDMLDFSESIFLFTSNSGSASFDADVMGFSGERAHNDKSQAEETLKTLKKEFSPEFRNRIDEFVIFNPLTKDNIYKIADLSLREYPIKRTDELIKFVAENGFSEKYGARELQRFIKKNVALPLADMILASKEPLDGTFEFDICVKDSKVKVINAS